MVGGVVADVSIMHWEQNSTHLSTHTHQLALLFISAQQSKQSPGLTAPCPACCLQVVCSVGAQSGAVELSSLAPSGRPRTHFYGIMDPIQSPPKGGSSSSSDPAVVSAATRLLQLSLPQRASTSAPAEALIAVPQSSLGFTLHPVVSEASLHASVANHHNPRVAPPLRVAARVEAIYSAAPAADAELWSLSLAARRGRQWVVGSAGAGVVGAFEGVESRRLVTQRPAVLTPR